MKKLLLILMLATLLVAGISAAQTKNGAIREGYTMLSQPLKFTAADSIAGFGGHHILTGDSLIILISNPQKYLQYHTITTTLAVSSGSGTITVNFYGKTTSGEGWHPIGTDATYTTGVTPVTVTGTTAANYNYLRVSYVQSGGTENAIVTAFEIKTANAFPYGATRVTGTAGLTVTGGTINLNVSSNNAVNIGTGTTTSTVTIGGAGAQTIALGNGAAAKTVALGSSNTTSTTTLLSGSGGLLLNVSNNQPTNIGTGTSTGLVTIGGGSGTAAVNTTSWGISNSGVATGFTGITSSGKAYLGNVIRIHTPAAYNSTGTISAANMLAGVLTSTSAQATSLTTPTATAIAAVLPGAAQGTAFDLIIDNSAGQSTVTLVLDGSITVVNPAIITGGGTLTVATLTTGKFSFYFVSGTAAKCYRVY